MPVGKRGCTGLSHMDFGELGEDVDEEVVVPTGPFQFATHGPFARFQPRQVQRQFAQQGQVFGTMTFPVSRLVFVAGYVQHPMQSVFNAPMSPHDVVASLRRPGLAQQVVTGFRAGLAVLLTGSRYLANSLQTRPDMLLLQPVNVGADAGDPGFDAPVSFANLGGLRHRRVRVVQEQFHVIVERTLIAFQRQRVVPALCQHLLGHLPLAVHGVGSNHLAAQTQHFQ